MKDNILGIVIGIVVLIILIYLYRRHKQQQLKTNSVDTGTGNSNNPKNTNTIIGTSGLCVATDANGNAVPGHYQNNVCVPNPSSTSTSIPTGTGTPSNQVVNPNGASTYYQVKNLKNPLYPVTYSGPISGIVFPQGKALTLVKSWKDSSGGGYFYETTEPVDPNVLSQHPEIYPFLFVKTTDVQ